MDWRRTQQSRIMIAHISAHYTPDTIVSSAWEWVVVEFRNRTRSPPQIAVEGCILWASADGGRLDVSVGTVNGQ